MLQEQKSTEKVSNESSLNFDKVKKAAIILRALNNPLRQRILDFLMLHETANVTSIMVNVREQQTVVSQQLAILRRAKIVSNLRKGKSVYYFINHDQVKHIQECASSIIEEAGAGGGG